MANLCTTTYKCVGDLKEVRSLHDILQYIDKRRTSIVENGFGKWWLGNLVTLKSASNLNDNLNCSKELEHYAS